MVSGEEETYQEEEEEWYEEEDDEERIDCAKEEEVDRDDQETTPVTNTFCRPALHTLFLFEDPLWQQELQSLLATERDTSPAASLGWVHRFTLWLIPHLLGRSLLGWERDLVVSSHHDWVQAWVHAQSPSHTGYMCAALGCCNRVYNRVKNVPLCQRHFFLAPFLFGPHDHLRGGSGARFFDHPGDP